MLFQHNATKAYDGVELYLHSFFFYFDNSRRYQPHIPATFSPFTVLQRVHFYALTHRSVASVFRQGVNVVFAHLGYYAELISSYRRFGTAYRSHLTPPETSELPIFKGQVVFGPWWHKQGKLGHPIHSRLVTVLTETLHDLTADKETRWGEKQELEMRRARNFKMLALLGKNVVRI